MVPVEILKNKAKQTRSAWLCCMFGEILDLLSFKVYGKIVRLASNRQLKAIKHLSSPLTHDKLM